MTKTLNILDRTIGAGERTLVIAEIGVNHDGSLSRALELVRIAAECGADAVKLQVFNAKSLMHASASFAAYQREQSDESDPAAMLRKYELPPLDLTRVVESIRAQGMIPLATPFSLTDVVTLASLDLPAIKIASPDLVNRPLLERAARLRKPMLLSTGAATMDEAAGAVAWLREWRVSFSLLHCVSSYPASNQDAHLCWISELAARFDVSVGYSDHTTDVMAGALAVSAGACVIEKHLTYDRSAPGPDHAASADPAQFREYVRLIRAAEAMRGRPGKRVLPIEHDVRSVSRQSLVSRRPLKPGDVLTLEDLMVQRPGTGIPAAEIDRVSGRRATRRIDADTLLQWDMLSDAA